MQQFQSNLAFAISIFDLLNDTFIVVDKDMVIRSINTTCARMFGYTYDELIDQPISVLIPASLHAAHQQYAQRYVTTPTAREMRHDVRLHAVGKNGMEIPVSISLNPVLDGDETFVIAVVRDMSDREKIEDDLFQAKKMEAVGTLSAGIAHDFNNIITAIIGTASLVKMKTTDDYAKKAMLDIIRHCQSASGITSDLMQYARRGHLDHKGFSANQLIKDAAEISNSCRSDLVEVDLHLPDSDINVTGDHIHLQQVIVNMLNNAKDALEGKNDGKISVSLKLQKRSDCPARNSCLTCSRGATKIGISDNGPGIGEDHLKRIFDPFFTTKPIGKGTGLGLAMSLASVQGMGGTIRVSSEIGVGTQFDICIPNHEVQE